MNEMSLGVDIEEVDRFRSLVRNRQFLNRVFTPQEIAYCKSKKNNAQHFAVRFSAKEAVWKALSEKIHRMKRPLTHKDIGVKNTEDGKPEVTLPKDLGPMARKISISLSHTRSYAVAVAVYRG